MVRLVRGFYRSIIHHMYVRVYQHRLALREHNTGLVKYIHDVHIKYVVYVCTYISLLASSK